MDSAIAILIAAVMAAGSPMYLDWRNGKRRQRERIEDFARQDRVAVKVDQVRQEARTATVETNSQLRQIHTLVNSDMTAARQSELTQTRATLAVLRRFAPEESVEIDQTEARIVELEAILADRMAQLKIVEAEAQRTLEDG